MFGDLGKVMKMARDMKQKMPEMRRQLDARQFVAQGGGGAVSATVNGKLQLVDLDISKEVLMAGDADSLADAIKTAVSAAQAEAVEAAAEMMQELTGGIDMAGMDGLLG